jgi:type I restriction enzyme S subunit
MENQLIPQLRFTEFSKNWEIKYIKNIAKVVGGGTPSTTNKEYWNGDINWFTPTEIKFDIVSESKRKITDLGLNKSSATLLPKGTILLTTRATIGEVAIAQEECTTNQGFQSLVVNKNNSNQFVFDLIKVYRKDLYMRANGSTFKEISKKEVEKIKVLIPSLIEQQKIASFLSNVDTVVTKLIKKKELLEQYKKGLMQKIFNQALRFKDDNGNEFPKWEEKKLRDLGNTLNGLTGKTKEDFGIGKPYIQYKQIFDSSKIDITNCGFVEISTSDNQTKMQYGDVFFTTSSETPNEIGTASVLLDEVEEMYLNSFCFGFRVLQTVLYPSFSQFLFRSNSFRKKMIPLAQGSTRYNISKSSFLKLKVQIPSIEEQLKIANFLSDIDVNIEAINNKIENCKAFKKGLLQQMFV